MINALKKQYQVDIIIKEFEGSVKFFDYYFDNDWLVAIKNHNTIEIYNQDGILIDEIDNIQNTPPTPIENTNVQNVIFH
ncbi:hypothetical protein [Paramaledivibacter caminithermalis]|jgi:hypothetical protein|uniref:Uncharacterized protein n=1 Tax=Paramaledivibacter caminithermalis (strain DSM 15212 / CIP 107654 / DViRD3) TaxID=1121301 RepID=A0A1M6PE87_PARC5|nr:hypothetical protein [Paramaledivibacter caminithermalis]SHK06247.1 hypothetical protein SAMN02745912_02130 [Paramaledivibacter caminithermalis DSM 15212]